MKSYTHRPGCDIYLEYAFGVGHLLKVQHIELLLAIERTGSIRAASKQLGRSQPAVTKALRQAEAELGAAIFKRGPSGAVVTEDGKPILRRAHVIQSELRKMQEEIEQRRGEGTGRLSVVVSPLAAERILPAAVRRFRRRFPRVDIHIGSGHEPMAFGTIRDGTVDVVIGPEPRAGDQNGLAVQFLFESPLAVVTGIGSRWAGTTELADLVEGDWLMIGTQARLPNLQKHFTSRGITPPNAIVTSDSIVSVLSMLQDSDYLCTFPALFLEQAVLRWRVEILPLSTYLEPARIVVATSSERPPTPALQYFCDCVLQIVRNASD